MGNKGTHISAIANPVQATSAMHDTLLTYREHLALNQEGLSLSDLVNCSELCEHLFRKGATLVSRKWRCVSVCIGNGVYREEWRRESALDVLFDLLHSAAVHYPLLDAPHDIDIDKVQLASRQTPLASTQLARTQSGRHQLPDPVQNEAGGKCSGRGRNDRRETVLASSNWESARVTEGGRSTLQITCSAGRVYPIRRAARRGIRA